MRPSLRLDVEVSTWRGLSALAQLYVGAVTAIGFSIIALSLPVVTGVDHALLALLVLLSIPVSLIKVRFPRTESTFTMSHVLDYLALLTLGARPAVLVAATGAWSQCTFRRRQ